jgi:predicted nucleic-acid-binding protein
MIAVDTNVLVRYLTNDDAVQASKAMAVLAGSDRILVTHTVLLELAWVLRAAYDLSPETINRSLLQVLGLPNVQIDKAEQIAQALAWYEDGMDFADALHLALATGVERFFTFDQRFVNLANALGLPVHPV